MSIRAEPRLTRDADLAVSVGNDAEAEALILALSQRGHRVLGVVEDDRTGRLSTARPTHLDSDRSVVTGPAVRLVRKSSPRS